MPNSAAAAANAAAGTSREDSAEPPVVRIHIEHADEAASIAATPAADDSSSSPPSALQVHPAAAAVVAQKATAAVPAAAASAADVLLSFRDLTIATHQDGRTIVKGLQGYVPKGGMMAIIGASGSGKTILMEALCGRSSLDLNVSGVVSLNGRVIHTQDANNMGFVPQEDMLIGELTVRETFLMSARLRQDLPSAQLEQQVTELIHGLGLDHVADNVVGTILKRGLSGGEKRRVSVGVELAARPSVICLDEPTSGLDASSAYVVMRSIQELARNSHGSLCVVASLHQPNSRLLDLFDCMMVLGRNSQLYFGPNHQARPYFDEIGFRCEPNLTSTDYIIHLADQRFRQANVLLAEKRELTEQEKREVSEDDRAFHFDFPAAYRQSKLGKEALQLIKQAENRCADASSAAVAAGVSAASTTDVVPSVSTRSGSGSKFKTSWSNQVRVLLERSALVATRDLTLYVLQFILNSFYGFMVGAEFYNLPTRIGARQNDYTNGIVWLVFVATYLQVFKVYFLMTWKERFHHEAANQSFSASAWSLANFLSTSFFTFITFIPGLVVGYFMMGMPADAIGYVIYVLFLVAMTAESTVDMLCQFIEYVPSAILVGQGTLVVLCVYAGGAFIRWSKLGFWVWLSEMSLYTWSTRGIMIKVFKHVSYECAQAEGFSTAGGVCLASGDAYPCDESYDATSGSCFIRGSTVLDVYKGVSETNEWYQAGILLLIMGLLRIFTYILLRFPVLTSPMLMFRLISGGAAAAAPSAEEEEESVAAAAAGAAIAKEKASVELTDVATHTVINVAASGSLPAMKHAASFVAASCSLRWSDLQLKLRSGDKVLVDNLQGEAEPGRVLAIMGPSGAGKTTLLNALSGRAPYAKITGSVSLGASPLTKSHLDYVPQFDVLNPISTVFDAFCIMSKLKSKENEECKKRVTELIEILGLTPRVNSRIGTLSSGDRKRVSIGLGLVSNPAVLFLDEPTTGLDSEAALVVVEYLIKVARQTGVVCIMTIHQPSSTIFSMLDDLLLLTKGVTAYFGKANKAQAYFNAMGFPVPEETNPADYYLDLMTGDAANIAAAANDGAAEPTQALLPTDPASWKSRFLAADNPYAYVANVSKASCLPVDPDLARPSESYRLMILTASRLRYFWQEKAIYWLRLLEMVLLAVFIGTLFLRRSHDLASMNEIAGSMFFSIWTVLFAAIGATPIFVRDRITAENEFLNGGYEIATHVGSLFLAALPYHLATAAIYQTIVWFLVGFNDSFEPWVFSTLSAFSLLVMMEGVSLIVVEFLQNAMLATTGTMVALGMMFLFPGFFIKVSDMVPAVAWLSWIVPTKYSLDSQLENILHGQDYGTGVSDPLSGVEYTISGDALARGAFKLDGRTKWGDWAIVMSYALAFRFLHYVVLKYRYRAFAKGKMAEDK